MISPPKQSVKWCRPLGDVGVLGTNRELLRSSRVVTVYRVVSRGYFHLPIVTVFFLSQGFSPLSTALLLAFYGLVAALADVPLSPLRRLLSLKGALMLGEALKIAGLVLLVGAVDPALAVGSQLLSGIGFSLTAGTDAALASSLRRGSGVASQESRVQIGMFLASFACGAIGATSTLIWDRLPFLLSAGTSLCAGAVLLWSRLPFLDGDQRDASAGGRPNLRENRLPGSGAFWAFYYSFNRGLLLSAYTFLIPLLLATRIGVPLPWFGLILGLYTLLGLLAARLSSKLAGSPVLLYVTVGSLVSGFALMVPGSLGLAVGGIALLGIAGGFVRPAALTALSPLVSGLAVWKQQTVMRRLERDQALMQAVLLVSTGTWVIITDRLAEAFLVYALIACIIQAVGVMLVSRSTQRGRDQAPPAV